MSRSDNVMKEVLRMWKKGGMSNPSSKVREGVYDVSGWCLVEGIGEGMYVVDIDQITM